MSAAAQLNESATMRCTSQHLTCVWHALGHTVGVRPVECRSARALRWLSWHTGDQQGSLHVACPSEQHHTDQTRALPRMASAQPGCQPLARTARCLTHACSGQCSGNNRCDLAVTTGRVVWWSILTSPGCFVGCPVPERCSPTAQR